MKNILVPTDFSDLAGQAIETAINLAKNTDTTIHLLHSVEILHVWDELSNYMDIGSGNQEGYSYMHVVKDKSKEKLEEFKKQVEDSGVKCIIAVEDGKPYQSVEQYVEYNDISLIVMGTKGTSGVAEMVLGSNAQKIIRNSVCPVLTIKEGNKVGDFGTILLASDFHEDKANDNIDFVVNFGKNFNSKIILLYIATPLNFLNEDELIKDIEDIAQKRNLKNYTVEVHKAESAEEGISEYCLLNHPDVVAITTHGKGWLRKMFISNTTEYLANHLDTPLLSMPMGNE